MHAYVNAIKAHFEPYANPIDALPMMAYMRNQFDYLGIKTPQRRSLLKEFITQFRLPKLEDLSIVLLELWQLPEREYQYIAVGILDYSVNNLTQDFIDTVEILLTTKSWWDTVDSLAINTVGNLFKRFPEIKQLKLPQWNASSDFWLKRTCILFQNGYKTNTDFNLLKGMIQENLGSDEFFINKAIGWALREYSKSNPDGVRTFVAETPLTPLSTREALKWINKQKKAKMESADS